MDEVTGLTNRWPSEKLGQMEREEEIQAFAKSRGWNALIHNSEGVTRAIFLNWRKGNGPH